LAYRVIKPIDYKRLASYVREQRDNLGEELLFVSCFVNV